MQRESRKVCFSYMVVNAVRILVPFMYQAIIWFSDSHEIKHVLKIIDPKNVVQIVTNNGSNKKTHNMLSKEYKHIVCQPCLAHIISLMSEDIGKWPDHEAIIHSVQHIPSWIY